VAVRSDTCIRQHTAYVSIRQHTSAYVSIRQAVSSDTCIRRHTSAYGIRKYTSAYVSMRQAVGATPLPSISMEQRALYIRPTSAYVRIRPHTSAYVAVESRDTSALAYVSIRQQTSAYVSKGTSALDEHGGEGYSRRLMVCDDGTPHVFGCCCLILRDAAPVLRQHPSAYISIRQHTSAYVCIRQQSLILRDAAPVLAHNVRQHTSAYVSIRQLTPAYVSIRQPHLASLRSSAAKSAMYVCMNVCIIYIYIYI
jgi:hypothetical protein